MAKLKSLIYKAQCFYQCRDHTYGMPRCW